MMAGGNANHVLAYSILRGGIAIHNPKADDRGSGGAYGTLGFIATSDGADRWVVSCYHVLCRKGEDMPDGVVEPLYHPSSQVQPSPVATVSSGRADRELDCAAGRILMPTHTVGEILGIGALADPVDPVVGMRVIKSGAQTGVTEGRITHVARSEIEISPTGFPDEYQLSEVGDSGSLWIDAATHSPVALHYRGSEPDTPARAFAKPIHAVLEVLHLRVVRA